MGVTNATPTELDATAVAGRTTLVVGPPHVGKTHWLRTETDLTRETRLAAVVDGDSRGTALDDLYTAWRVADETAREAFPAAVRRAEELCVTVRTRDLDWLMAEATAFDAGVVDAFDEVIRLRYDPSSDRETAVDACATILAESGETRPETDRLDTHADDLLYHPEIELSSDRLRELLGETTGASLVPPLVVFYSDRFDGSGGLVSATGVRDALTEVGATITENASAGAFLSATKDVCGRLLSSEAASSVGDGAVSVASAGLAGTAGPAGAIAASLAVLNLLRSDDDAVPTETAFGGLLAEDLSPSAREKLEAELDLPPRTIDRFRQLVRGDTLHEVVTARENDREIDRRLGDVEDAAAEFEQEVTALTETVERLDDHAIHAEWIEAFLSSRIAAATTDLDGFREQVHDEEAALLADL
ncbi:MAG: hypothetical protein ABEI99_09695, partial [Halobaculum sp.]